MRLPPVKHTHTLTDVAALLQHTMDVARALTLRTDAANELGLTADLTISDALALLEHLFAVPGIVGISALRQGPCALELGRRRRTQLAPLTPFAHDRQLDNRAPRS